MAHAQPTSTAAEKAEQNFFELLSKFEHAMLVTHSPEGPTLHARPMAIADIGADGSIWFLTGRSTPKIDEIKQDAHVLAVLQKDKQWLSVSGSARLERDRARIHQVWKESFRTWFQGKDDPEIVLIRVLPEAAEYWDNTGLKGLKFALKAAAAYLGDKPLRGSGDVNVHAKVPL